MSLHMSCINPMYDPPSLALSTLLYDQHVHSPVIPDCILCIHRTANILDEPCVGQTRHMQMRTPNCHISQGSGA